MKRILFVEDNLGLIEQLVQLLFRMREGGLEIRYATDVPQAMKRLRAERFDVVVLDVMLPGVAGVPPDDEGIHLAAWILRKKQSLPVALHPGDTPFPAGSSSQRVIFLASRTGEGVTKTYRKVTGEKCGVKVIERLKVDTYEQAAQILKLVDASNGNDAVN